MALCAILLVCGFRVALGGSAHESDHVSLLQTNQAVLQADGSDYAEFEGIPPTNLARQGKKAHRLEMNKKAQLNGQTYAQLKGQTQGTDAVRLIDFTMATIVYNNLGGQGPQKTLASGAAAPEEIRYSGLVRGLDVDLVITAAPGYKAYNPSKNGMLLMSGGQLSGNGQVNAKSGTSASLTYTFVAAGTNTPHVMPLFYITFSDVDERHGGAEKERISASGYDQYYTNDDLALVNDGQSTATFQSSDFGDYADNAFYAAAMSPTAMSHSVTFKFTNKATFNATFAIEEHRDFNAGRNIEFSGISQLVFCQDPSVYLDFKSATATVNNLGGHGPSAGEHQIRYSNIATTAEGQALDLVATADETYGYTAWNSSQNGRKGDFGLINLYSGPTQNNSEAYITFTVVESGTNALVTLPQFAFVVFDFDMGLHEQQIEYVEMHPNAPGFDGGSGYSSYITTNSTEIARSNDKSNGNRKFAATKHGTEADNPSFSQTMSRETADKSVVFTFRKTSSFKIILGITPTGQNTGRNFMFSGQDMYLMCD